MDFKSREYGPRIDAGVVHEAGLNGPEALIRGCVTLKVERSVVLFERCDDVNQNMTGRVRNGRILVSLGDGGERGTIKKKRKRARGRREIVVKDMRRGGGRRDEWKKDERGGGRGASRIYMCRIELHVNV